MMGFQDALYMQNISYASHEAVEFADKFDGDDLLLCNLSIH